MSIFRLSKDLYEIKSEFSVYDKLVKGNVSVSKRMFNVRDVIMTVLYPFFEDFSKKNVVVNVEQCYASIPLDFETFQVAMYHIIENASKYIRNKTSASISFSQETNFMTIQFVMQSLFISENEAESIFFEGISGETTQKSKLSGEGIGMYRAKKLIEINGGTLVVKPGKDVLSDNNVPYAVNKFIIQMPLND